MKKYLLIAVIVCIEATANNTGRPLPRNTISLVQNGGISVSGRFYSIAKDRINFHNQSTLVYQRHVYYDFWIVANAGVNTWRDFANLPYFNEQGEVLGRMGLSNNYNTAFAGLGLTYQVQFTRKTQLNFTVVGNYHNRYSDYSVVVKTENMELSKEQRQELKENSNPGRLADRESFQLVVNPNMTGRLKRFGMKNELRWQAGLYGAYSFHKKTNSGSIDLLRYLTIENFLVTGLQFGLIYAW